MGTSITRRRGLWILAALAVLLGVADAQDLAKEVQHPAGVGFRCPEDWGVKEDAGQVRLAPPNPNPLGEAPSYAVVVIPAEDATGPDDPRLAAMLEKQSQDSAPYLGRVGGAEPAPIDAGRGVVLTWEGKDDKGTLMRARARIGVVGDKLVFLLARSTRFTIDQHDPLLAAVFRTIRGPVAAPVAGGRFEGKFTDGQLVLTLAKRGALYEGTVELAGNSFPIAGREDGDGLAGEFKAGEHTFAFAAKYAGDKLDFTTGGTTYHLEREGGGGGAVANPLAAGGGGAGGGGTPAQPADIGRLRDLGPVQPDPNREWTIVVYLDGDNDLEPFALKDLVEMEFGLPHQGVEVIVLIDRAKGFSDAEGDWTDARVYRVVKDENTGRIASTLLASPGEVNMGDPEVLATFLGAALKTFPARGTMLIMWDHGGGWASMASDFDAPGAPDGHDSLTLPEAAAGIREGLKNAGLDKLSLIGFDMCLMAQLETAAELAGLADVLVASQAIEPGDGWPFNEILPVFGKGTLGSRRLGQEIVRAYSRYYDEKNADVATLSALDLALTGEVVEAFEAFIAKITPLVPKSWAELSRSIFYSEAYADRTDIRRGRGALASVDLMDMVKRMRYSVEGFPAEAEYRKLVEVMDRFVLASHMSPKRRLSNGLALYAPVHGEMLDPEYMKTRLAGVTGWPQFLSALHEVQQANASEPKFTDMKVTDEKGHPIPAIEAQSNHRVSFTLTGKNIVWTQVWSGQDDAAAGGMLVHFKGFVVDPLFWQRRRDAVADAVDLVMPKYVDGVNQLYQDADGLALKVTDGSKAYGATIDATALDDPDNLRVPILLSHPSAGEIGGTILFNARWWQASGVIGEIPQPDGRLMYRQVEPPKDATVTLLYETVTADGSVKYTRGASFAWGDGPELLLDAADAGEHRAIFIAETITGNRGVASIPFKVKESAWIGQVKSSLQDFDPSWFLGTWQQCFVKEKLEPTGVTYKIEAHPSDRDLLVATGTSEKQPNVKLRQILWPDTRLLPGLRIFELDDKGNEIGFFLATLGAGQYEGKPMFYYKLSDVSRLMLAMVRIAPPEGGGGAGAGGGGVNPPPPTRDPLIGKWQSSEDGSILVCDGQNFGVYMYNELVMTGRYAIQGNRLTVQYATGERMTFVFAVQGGQLALQDEYGEVTNFRKIE